MSVTIDAATKRMNISQVTWSMYNSHHFTHLSMTFDCVSIMFQLSLEWPVTFRDVVQWQQHKKKTGVFFHEENICKCTTLKKGYISFTNK